MKYKQDSLNQYLFIYELNQFYKEIEKQKNNQYYAEDDAKITYHYKILVGIIDEQLNTIDSNNVLTDNNTDLQMLKEDITQMYNEAIINSISKKEDLDLQLSPYHYIDYKKENTNLKNTFIVAVSSILFVYIIVNL